MNEKTIKTMILPIVSVLLLTIGNSFGLSAEQIDFLNDAVAQIINYAIGIIAIYGVIKSHRKKDKKNTQESQ